MRNLLRLLVISIGWLAAALPALAQGDTSIIRIRVSVKQFGNNPYLYTQQQLTSFLEVLNGKLAEMKRGLAFEVTELVTLQTQNLPVTMPSVDFYTGPNVSHTLNLLSLNLWWLDQDPSTGCSEPIPNFEASRAPDGEVIEISPRDEYIELWTHGIKDNKSAFQYRTNACNFYLVWPEYCGGFGKFPGSLEGGDNLMMMSGLSESLFLHEWGHWAGLYHTFASAELQRNQLGDDDIEDTPTDTWDFDLSAGTFDASGPVFDFLNGISLRLYGQTWTSLPGADNDAPRSEVLTMSTIAVLKFLEPPNYTRRALTAAELDAVEATWVNIMSYHKHAPTLSQLDFSEGQLDKTIDNLSFTDPIEGRANVVSGLFHFVGPGGTFFFRQGSSKNPYPTIQQAVDAADPIGDDVLLLRPGIHHFSGTISKPLTLRATRQGPVTITAP